MRDGLTPKNEKTPVVASGLTSATNILIIVQFGHVKLGMGMRAQ